MKKRIITIIVASARAVHADSVSRSCHSDVQFGQRRARAARRRLPHHGNATGRRRAGRRLASVPPNDSGISCVAPVWRCSELQTFAAPYEISRFERSR